MADATETPRPSGPQGLTQAPGPSPLVGAPPGWTPDQPPMSYQNLWMPTPAPPTNRPGIRGNRPVLIGAGAAIVIIVALVIALVVNFSSSSSNPPAAAGGNSGPILQTPAGPATNADTWLTSADTGWRATVGQLTSDRAKVGDGARCYYILDSSTHQFTSTVACGPIRRLGSADKHVWDLESVQILTPGQMATTDNPATSNSTALQLYLGDPGPQGAPRPTGTFYRPDGTQPAADADNLAAPPMPTADTNLLTSFDVSGQPTTNATTVDPTKATIITPAGVLTLSAVAQVATYAPTADSTDTTTSSTATPSVFTPAAGHHFEVFTGQFTPGWPSEDGNTIVGGVAAPTATFTFISGTTRTDITKTIAPPVGQYDTPAPTSFSMIASVANSTPAKIDVGVGGHDQTITVDTATRDPDPLAAAYYDPARSTSVNSSAPVMTKNYASQYDQNVTVTYALNVDQATFSPYNPTKGWADTGKVWLNVSATDKVSENSYNTDTINRDGWTVSIGKTKYTAVTVAATDNGAIASFEVPSTPNTVTGSFLSSIIVNGDTTTPSALVGSAAKFSLTRN